MGIKETDLEGTAPVEELRDKNKKGLLQVWKNSCFSVLVRGEKKHNETEEKWTQPESLPAKGEHVFIIGPEVKLEESNIGGHLLEKGKKENCHGLRGF